MKILILISASIILLSLALYGCKKEKEKIHTDLELPIVSELPILYQGCNLKEGETMVIKNQEGFDTVFNRNQISQIAALQNIDFSKYDVLVGADVFTHGISRLEYRFTKSDTMGYIYEINVIYNDTLPAGTFFYGIIIDKLPVGTPVNFKVTKKY